MTDILSAAQQAIVATLANDAKVQSLIGSRVYDHVPQDAAFPYLAFGPAHVAPKDTKEHSGFEHIVTLNIWSQYRGGKETREIFQAMYDALHRANLSAAGEEFISCGFHSADFSAEKDGMTYFAATRFLIATQSL